MLAEDIVGYETMIGADPTDIDLHDDVALLYLQLGTDERGRGPFRSLRAAET